MEHQPINLIYYENKIFILVIDRDFIISSGWGRISIYEETDYIKTATNTSQGTPRSVDPASWIIACYDVEDSKLFIDIPVPCGTLTVSVSDSLTGEMAYYQSYFDESCIVVDMSGTKVGDYVLEISIGETLLLGGFSIE